MQKVQQRVWSLQGALLFICWAVDCIFFYGDRKSGSAGMPRPRSTLFPYTTLFRSRADFLNSDAKGSAARLESARSSPLHLLGCGLHFLLWRSEERFSRNAETEIYTLSLHDALPISR